MDEITPATGEDWRELEIEASTPEGHTARAVLELLQRLARVEPVPAPQAPQGVTVEELACILSEAPVGDLGMAYWLLNHPRLVPLLRGEGAPVQSLQLSPTQWTLLAFTVTNYDDEGNYRETWQSSEMKELSRIINYYARAEVARQQGGQADG